MIKGVVLAVGVLSSVAATAVEPTTLMNTDTVGVRAGYKLEFGNFGSQPMRHSLALTSGTTQNARTALEYRWTSISSDLRIGGNSVRPHALGVSGNDDPVAPWSLLTGAEWVYVIGAGSAIIAALLTAEHNRDGDKDPSGPPGSGVSN